MDAVTSIGILVGAVSVAYNFPFTYRIVKNRSARDVDTYFLIMRIIGTILYIIYGVLISDYYIITANVVPVICTVIILIIKIRYSKRSVTWNEIYLQIKKIKDKYHLDTNTQGWSELKNYILDVIPHNSTEGIPHMIQATDV